MKPPPSQVSCLALHTWTIISSVIHSEWGHGVPEVDKGKASMAERVGDVNRTEQIGDFSMVRSCHSVL